MRLESRTEGRAAVGRVRMQASATASRAQPQPAALTDLEGRQLSRGRCCKARASRPLRHLEGKIHTDHEAFGNRTDPVAKATGCPPNRALVPPASRGWEVAAQRGPCLPAPRAGTGSGHVMCAGGGDTFLYPPTLPLAALIIKSPRDR